MAKETVRQFRKNLTGLYGKDKIGRKLFFYLYSCSIEQAYDTLVDVLDTKYNEDLDWLFSTLPQNQVIIEREISLPPLFLN